MESRINKKTKIQDLIKKIGSALVFLLIVFGIIRINPTFSLFHDEAQIKGITFTAADDFSPEGNVIINEVMWMGSEEDEDDQWIELKNISDQEVHLKGWYLTYKNDNSDEKELLEIKDNRVIKKGEYFLMTHFKKNNSAIDVNPDTDDLSNFDYADFQIKLYDGEKRLIDVAGDGDGEPKKGSAEHFYSMQRKDKPGYGADYDNWYSCQDSDSWKYWDNQAQFGTPGGDNLDGENESARESSKEQKSKTADVVPVSVVPPVEEMKDSVQEETILPVELKDVTEPISLEDTTESASQ